MEQVRTARRAASHGSLGRRYAADADFYPRIVSSSHPFGRPLRSVNENTSLSLLASPGPLESMLKKTTETGDIGIFSIRPSRSSATVHGGPLRPRPGYGDTNWQRPPRGNRTDTPGFRDDRLRFPRYRDTASEIISMYGSGSQRSASSSLSHPYDDMAHRSYSMTSCSSRPMPNKKSSGTLKSQSSGAYLQRPRSPFPYPTRLKRPGVRPSSPAWTENGGVDYSRMIQIDRFSHRTVHGSYKPTYPHYGRRGTPGLPRFDPNRSAPSLSSYNTLPRLQYSSVQASSAPTTWTGRYRDRLETGRSDNSLRSSSLTSIVDMYRPASCAPTGQDPYFRTQSGSAFYYDYSEDFDQAPPMVRPPLAPLAPVPTRDPSLHRPMILDETCSMRLRDGNNQDLTTVFHAKFPMELSSGQEIPGKLDGFLPPMETTGDSPKGEAPDAPLGSQVSGLSDARNPRPSGEETRPLGEITNRDPALVTPPIGNAASLPEGNAEQQPVSTLENNRGAYGDKVVQARFGSVTLEEIYEKRTRTSIISQARSSSQPPDSRRSLSLSHEKKASISSTVSGYLRRSKFYSIEPGLSDLASLVQCLDKAAQSSALYDTSSDTVIAHHEEPKAEQPQEPEASEVSPAENTEASNLSMSHSKDCGDCEGDDPDGFRAHRRQHAVTSFDTNDTLGAAKSGFLQPTESVLPIFAPQPISPARRLRLQNGVPQLMKALPPLPNPRDGELCFNENSPGGLDISMRFSPEYEGGPTGFLDHVGDRRTLKSSNGKLKLRIPRRGIPRVREAQLSYGQNIESQSSALWPQGSSGNSRDDEGGSDRDPISTDSEHFQEGSVIGLEPCVEEVAVISSPESTGPVIKHEVMDNRESLAGNLSSSHKPQKSASVASISDLRSTFSDRSTGSHKPSRGLRKRVSDLRIRLVESRLKSTESRGSPGKRHIDVGVGTTSTLAPTSTTVVYEECHEKKSSVDGLGQVPPVQSRGFRGRMSKWMTTVRQAVMVACTGSRKRG